MKTRQTKSIQKFQKWLSKRASTLCQTSATLRPRLLPFSGQPPEADRHCVVFYGGGAFEEEHEPQLLTNINIITPTGAVIQHLYTHEHKHMHRGCLSLSPDTAAWFANHVLIQLLINQCLCSRRWRRVTALGQGVKPPPPLTVRDTVNAVYCLCLTGSQQEMACKKLFVWRGWGHLNETRLLSGPRMDGVAGLSWAKTRGPTVRRRFEVWEHCCQASKLHGIPSSSELPRCVYSTRDIEHFWRAGVDTQSERTEATFSADELCNTASFFFLLLLFIGEISSN